ncbi:hypothetical protein [Flagellimonas meridianipacifica]|uniref:Uncharacterized protein n=1 Tax=Flagellimonas meridianipacifica TaxID=1080225 RepID=A0A2T0M8X0_9FLAO|nr:hypothetical protein [Allomuricauda pacifica]PRX53944.1 hypothetical protein CLV81_2337 [Allomuricauda pacifica]
MTKIAPVLFLLFLGVMNGQNTSNNVTTITYEPPSISFIALELQTYNGKLRFGEQDNYYTNPDGSYVKHNDGNYPEIDKKSSHNVLSQYAFRQLLKIRHQQEIFDAMDKELFTVRKNDMYDKELKSLTAQEQLLVLANTLLSTEEQCRLFCNEKQQDCAAQFKDDGYYRPYTDIAPWGGKGATEFQQLRAFKTVANEFFPKMQQWGNSLYPENKIDGYYVGKTRLGTYDFKSGGYWLDTNQFHNQGFLLRWYNLQPKTTSERKLKHPNGSQLLLELSPEKAEAFSEKYDNLYLVFEVNVALNGIENYRMNRLKTLFTLVSPTISLYVDDGLTNKVGELDLGSATIKTR